MKRTELIPVEYIEQQIFLVRGQKVMIDVHLAELYGVSTKAFIQAVKRNPSGFPRDFAFQLITEEHNLPAGEGGGICHMFLPSKESGNVFEHSSE